MGKVSACISQGCTTIIRRADPFFGFKFLNFNICLFFFYFFFWGGRSEKINHFRGYEDFVDIFGGSSQNWTSFRSHISMYFMVFS